MAIGYAFALPAAAQKLEDVNYLMPAPVSLPSMMPWLLAHKRGYFEREGLNVHFQTVNGGVDAALQVGAGNGAIGSGIGETTIVTRSNGVPSKTVAVLGGGAFTQLVLPDSPSGPKDLKELKGKTIGVLSYQDTSYYSLLGMLASAGLTKRDVDIQSVGLSVWQQFAAGKVDAMAATINWALDAREAGKKIRLVRSDKYFPSMAQAIIASDEMIKKRPELIRKLVRATLRGMKDIIDEGPRVIPDYVAAAPTMKGKEKLLSEVVSLYVDYVYKGQKILGAMNPDQLATVQKFYVSQGIVTKPSPLDQLYTNEFVQ